MTDQEKQRFLKYWKARRFGGKARFILRDALFSFVLIFVASILFDLIDHSLVEALAANITPKSFLSKTIIGLLLAFWQWRGQEALFRKIEP